MKNNALTENMVPELLSVFGAQATGTARSDILSSAAKLAPAVSVQREASNCGFLMLASTEGKRSHALIDIAGEYIKTMEPRGGIGEDGTSDGAGILTRVHQPFYRALYAEQGGSLALDEIIAPGMFFIPEGDEDAAKFVADSMDALLEEFGFDRALWRDVPVNAEGLPPKAEASRPQMKQLLIPKPDGISEREFNAHLWLMRKQFEQSVRESHLPKNIREQIYVPSMGSKLVSYTALTTAGGIVPFYPDLQDLRNETDVVLAHRRFSTGTHPAWKRSHPNRYMAHNGEVTTLQGNINSWPTITAMIMPRLEKEFGEKFGAKAGAILAALDTDGTDSAILDNAIEFLIQAGFSLPSIKNILVPQVYDPNRPASAEVKEMAAFIDARFVVWAGPMGLVFTDGDDVMVTTDQKGSRPRAGFHYYDEKAGNIVVLGSEKGGIPVPQENLIEEIEIGRGEMFNVNLRSGVQGDRLVRHTELQQKAALEILSAFPTQNVVSAKNLPASRPIYKYQKSADELLAVRMLAGHSLDDEKTYTDYLVRNGASPKGSMGSQSESAVGRNALKISHYFKQLFAQATAPAAAADKEKHDMNLSAHLEVIPDSTFLRSVHKVADVLGSPDFTSKVFSAITNYAPARFSSWLIGPEGQKELIRSESPLLSRAQLQVFRQHLGGHFVDIDCTFDAFSDKNGHRETMRDAHARILKQAIEAARAGKVIFLTDEEISDKKRISAKVGLSGGLVQEALTQAGLRGQTDMIGLPSEIPNGHEVAFDIGMGGFDFLHFWLAEEAIIAKKRQGFFAGISEQQCVDNQNNALTERLAQIMAKRGVCHKESYKGARLFEGALISAKTVGEYFPGVESELGGIDLEDYESILIEHHKKTLDILESDPHASLPLNGDRFVGATPESVKHNISSKAIEKLQRAVEADDWEEGYKLFCAFEDYIDADNQKYRIHPRDSLEFNSDHAPISIDLVEPVEEIFGRFQTADMSYGALSKEAWTTLAQGMNMLRERSTSKFHQPEAAGGEGGMIEDEVGTDNSPGIGQIGTSRYGITGRIVDAIRVLRTKMGQAAKAGMGGDLPPHKATPDIAKARFSTPYVNHTSINHHVNALSIEGFSQDNYDSKKANPNLRTEAKLVSTGEIGYAACGMAKADFDGLVIAGAGGGTGAALVEDMEHAVLPWELGLSKAHKALTENNLRAQMRLTVDGAMRTSRDFMMGFALGADCGAIGFQALALFYCNLLGDCHLNNCPYGIATQDPDLRANFKGKPEFVVRFFEYMAQRVRERAAALGYEKIDDLIGQAGNVLRPTVDNPHKYDFTEILRVADHGGKPMRCTLELGQRNERPNLDYPDYVTPDQEIIQEYGPRILAGEHVEVTIDATTVNRATGVEVSHFLRQNFTDEELKTPRVTINVNGVLGQSPLAYGGQGIILNVGLHDGCTLVSGANDDVAKCAAGGEINMKGNIGNIGFLGATGITANINGYGLDRTGICLSGKSDIVIKKVGEYGFEFARAGRGVILEEFGDNLLAGVAAGEFYVNDPKDEIGRKSPDGSKFATSVPVGKKEELRLRVRDYAEKTKDEKWLRLTLKHEWEAAVQTFKYINPVVNANLPKKARASLPLLQAA